MTFTFFLPELYIKGQKMPDYFIGWFHTIPAFIALLTGSLILAKAKGTDLHKKIGRVYGISMLIVCVTSFMINRVLVLLGCYIYLLYSVL